MLTDFTTEYDIFFKKFGVRRTDPHVPSLLAMM